MREIVVFGGSAHPALTAEICAFLTVPQQPVRLQRFANDCLEVQLQANCRERDVFLIQPLVYPVQEHLVELLLMADAARGASAARVTAVIPHYAYARSDKKDQPRISIGGRLVADLLVTAGVDRVLTLTLHSPQVHGFFSVPVDHLHALRELANHFRGRDLTRGVVVAPDLGYAKSASQFARRLGVPVAAGAKERISDTEVQITAIIGDVADRDVIVIDDEISRGTTVFELLDRLREQRVRSVAVACTHGLFADNALDKLTAADVTEVVCTNSAPVPADHPKLHVLSVAPALAEAISHIHDGESVSALFHSRLGARGRLHDPGQDQGLLPPGVVAAAAAAVARLHLDLEQERAALGLPRAAGRSTWRARGRSPGCRSGRRGRRSAGRPAR